MRLPKHGLHIVLEGPEAAGKDTQLSLLHIALAARYRGILVTREPGTSELGELTRTYLAAHSGLDFAQKTLLYAAQRIPLYHSLIRPALAEGRLVLGNRWGITGLVYQGIAENATPAQRRQLDLLLALSTDGVWPDLTILLDIPAEVVASRLAARAKKEKLQSYDTFPTDFHQRVVGGYRSMAHQYPNRIKLVDGTADEAGVHAAIMAVVEPYLVGRPADPLPDYRSQSTGIA